MKIKRKRYKLGETEKKILIGVGLGLLFTASLALPNLPAALQPIFKLRGNKALRKILENIKKKGLINLGGEKIKLTAKGKRMLREIELSDLKLAKPKEWDGVWRLVSYDIPEKYKKSRDFFSLCFREKRVLPNTRKFMGSSVPMQTGNRRPR